MKKKIIKNGAVKRKNLKVMVFGHGEVKKRQQSCLANIPFFVNKCVHTRLNVLRQFYCKTIKWKIQYSICGTDN